MAKERKIFVCQSCGTTSGKWAGQCEACNEWNSIVEERDISHPTGLGKGSGNRNKGHII
ncbi:MAG: DNA repair protein RadA, partial [Alphaproteobacteria bacterium]